ncbi:uncharacterized protein LOC115629932 [Scaptodrosophila lebanonensis]|uniref:Uncharacterized protein LOC115629932 n=1 Tax=Drosophila lebanonensis TaxID=7225 RepID=A0A6J2U5H8_DROLE|nr:uncharacterized protein LOC115629932 [Scaptodrosophila lebanonensis]
MSQTTTNNSNSNNNKNNISDIISYYNNNIRMSVNIAERQRRDGRKKNPSSSNKLKITAATSAALPTLKRTSSSLTLPVNVLENKSALGTSTPFSYQRATERCARRYGGNNNTINSLTTTTTARAQTEAKAEATTTTFTNIQCEPTAANNRTKSLRLAKHKAQLRAAFYKEIYALHIPNDEGDDELDDKGEQQKQQKQQQQRTAGSGEVAFEFPQVKQLIAKFDRMIVKREKQQSGQEQELQQPQTQTHSKELPRIEAASTANSDEGCTAGLSPCSSDNEDAGSGKPSLRKAKVARCASSDSALGLDVDDAPPVVVSQKRRLTLTVTDLPLRPALLPLAEPTALPDSPLTSPTGPGGLGVAVGVGGGAGVGVGVAAGSVPSKVLLEERLVGITQEPRNSITMPNTWGSTSRRESTQSCVSELGCVRYVRTPSVVVSDYSDDIIACGISMEEMEYFRLQRARSYRRCSLDAVAGGGGGGVGAPGTGGVGSQGAKEGSDVHSDVSAASSCSNLYYCGSTISALDGGECIVNGVRVALARKSSSQSSSGDLSGDEDEEEMLPLDADGDADVDADDDDDDAQQTRQLSELLAATQLETSAGGGSSSSDVGDVGTKKVGSSSRRKRRSSSGRLDNHDDNDDDDDGDEDGDDNRHCSITIL